MVWSAGLACVVTTAGCSETTTPDEVTEATSSAESALEAEDFSFKNTTKNGLSKGKLKYDKFSLDLQIANELSIREPSMCDGGGSAKITWDESKNEVKISAKFDGLPYRPTYDYGDYLGNPGHTINPMPDVTEDGVWQMWLIGRWGTIESTWYYDGTTGDLLGNETEFAPGGRFGPNGPPAGAIPVTVPAFHMICTHTFESNPNNLKANVDFTFDYHQILDSEGTGGAYSTILPTNLFDPSTLDLVAVVGGVPAEDAMDWDDVLADLQNNSGAIGLYTSLEPDPKPAYLASRDNSMIGWASVYPPTAINDAPAPAPCGTYQLDGWFGFIP
ncbi:MAG: hypothetical protein RIF41_09170 [Polyangiaceae bacterium]